MELIFSRISKKLSSENVWYIKLNKLLETQKENNIQGIQNKKNKLQSNITKICELIT